MKVKDVPQDDANLFEGKTRDVQYALDENGKYTTVKSVGWAPKNVVMQQAWDVENEKIDKAKNLVVQGQRSPIYYYMYKCLMNVGILSGYTGFPRRKVKKHFKPLVFSKLSDEQLDKYVYAFNLKNRNELTNFQTL